MAGQYSSRLAAAAAGAPAVARPRQLEYSNWQENRGVNEMFRWMWLFTVALTATAAAGCRCAGSAGSGEADGAAAGRPAKAVADHVTATPEGERVVVGPSKAESSPPPALPGERRRPRGAPSHPEPTTPDPVEGPYTLARATEGLEGAGALVAVIHADLGRLRCVLDAEKAPTTVAAFVGLARGKRPWWDPYRGEWVERAFYNGLNVYRVIPGTKVEGGCPQSAGEGGPGFTYVPEIVAGFGHDAAGVLSMVVDDDGRAGSRFFVTDGPAPHFNGRHAPFGRCTPTDAVFRFARVPQAGENRPLTDIMIRSVAIEREE
jgi:peptidyl-prolyl cis-trans isomerase A (cyclophilin A)